MNQEGPLFHKPKSFLTARNLIYATIFIGLLGFAVREFMIGTSNNEGAVAVATTIAGYLMIWLLYKLMSRTIKWARTVLVVWYILIFISFTLLFKPPYVISLIEIALLTLQSALMILTIIFLYKKECNIWFNSSTTEILP